jgi:hypothetical protein
MIGDHDRVAGAVTRARIERLRHQPSLADEQQMALRVGDVRFKGPPHHIVRRAERSDAQHEWLSPFDVEKWSPSGRNQGQTWVESLLDVTGVGLPPFDLILRSGPGSPENKMTPS